MPGAILAAVTYGLILVVLSPVLVVGRMMAVAPLPPRLRNTARLLLVFAAFLALFEIAALPGTTPGRVGGREQAVALFSRLSRRLYGPGLALACMRLEGAEPPPAIDGRPVIVLARHAGVLNAPLVVYLISRDLHRLPRAVAKASAAPTVGLRRLYTAIGVKFYNFGGEGRAAASLCLRRMARTATADDALLLFPEGTNYTSARRNRAIAALRAEGNHELATSATGLTHMLHPQPGGAWLLAANAPTADVLVLAHTGLEDLIAFSGQIGYPLLPDGIVHTAWWHTPAAQVPRDRDGFQHWLVGEWQRADAWIGDTRERQLDARPS